MKYSCPMCGAELVESFGNQVFPGDRKHGVTLTCPSYTCPAQEVMGHGDNAKEAFEVITHKYKGGK